MSTNIAIKNKYYMFHKPMGCITAHTDSQHKTVMEYFQEPTTLYPGLHPVGRLDKDTEGLILITNDGHFNQRLMRPESHIVKTYEFLAMGNFSKEQITEIENGIYFTGDNKKTAPCKLAVHHRSNIEELLKILQENNTFHKFHLSDQALTRLKKNRPAHGIMAGTISITEGRKHHVKRLIKHGGGCVIALRRISIGELRLDETLAPGQYRELTPEELEKLF